MQAYEPLILVAWFTITAGVLMRVMVGIIYCSRCGNILADCECPETGSGYGS